MIVAGEGWVCGSDEIKIPLASGKAAFWETGEFHAAGTDSDMTVLTVEGKKLHACNLPILKNIISND
ncbi:hypothetical protein [Oceanobacillus sp. CFH 90083]|uniref:hypothetical protein n=1 Tax=Oceanobacillus sp. CFH 90083 TaxID=2592336 RepID=UPI00128D2B6F|nr:hypothetical protein [Oceanobacillus sp. CFH 90083]